MPLNRLGTESVRKEDFERFDLSEPDDNEKKDEDCALPVDHTTALLLTVFMPNYFYGPWRNPEDDDNAWYSVVIWLASSVDYADDFKLTVSNCGMFLEYTIYWRKVFHDTVDVHWMWLNGIGGTPKLEWYHPMIKCLRKFISVMQDRTNERVFQVARIPLRFQCESSFEVYLQKWSDGLRMLYVMLHAPIRNTKRARTRIQFVSLDETGEESNKLDETLTSTATNNKRC